MQIYTPGRTATIGDVLLDTTGSMIGILIMKGLLKLFH
ncbi:VanZ family protein [Veillonella rogosae]